MRNVPDWMLSIKNQSTRSYVVVFVDFSFLSFRLSHEAKAELLTIYSALPGLDLLHKPNYIDWAID